jgi:hypothetical protein
MARRSNPINISIAEKKVEIEKTAQKLDDIKNELVKQRAEYKQMQVEKRRSRK